ncbi:MAG: hypothetical protein CMP61_05855 [Flavobacteriales bacterium]|nr:hypothetical protein [Flavobacteriales bacterium]|tara:strand:- start:5415 stop:5798 length:384 start_codon:yes stop_codon:yes gene_type:complete
MKDHQIDSIINNFLNDFNKMCQSERKDFLEREQTVNYEYGSEIKKYKVVYQVRKSKNIWLIEAVNNGFWIFKKRFPLFKITRKKDKINLTGLFTHSIKDFELKDLENKLKLYLSICKNQPNDIFTKS